MNRHIQHLSSGAGKRRARGVTLIELLITVAIVAIIAAIAIPSYNTYVLRTHRTEAKSALLSMAAAEERFYSTQNALHCGADTAGLHRRCVSHQCGQQLLFDQHACRSDSGNHHPQAAYTLIATPINSQVADTACATFSIDQSGTQTATGSATATVDCWK